MGIDRNARVRFVARLQSDRSLTLGDRAVGRVIIMDFLDCRTSRARVDYDRIARAAGVDRRTVSRALPKLGRYIEVFRSHRARAGRNGGTVRARDVNTYLVTIPAEPCSHKGQAATGTTDSLIPMAMDPALAAVLARFGTAIADERDRCSRVNMPGGGGDVHA